MATASRNLHCVVVTPERALIDVHADFIALPMYDGELGVLPGRAPLIGRLGFGDLRIREGNSTTHVYVEGGFVQVKADTFTVLTSRALRPEEINPEAANQALATALAGQKEAVGAEAQEAQLVAQQKARTQMRVASFRSTTASG